MPLYSEEVQDIMGRIPGRILKFGLGVIFGVMMLLLLGSYCFKYPEIISCPVFLTTINPPQELSAQTTGKITLLGVNEQDTIEEDYLIAMLQNTAKYEDTQALERYLKMLGETTDRDSVVICCTFPDGLKVGELQGSYLQLCRVWKDFRRYLSQGYLPLKISLQGRQLERAKIEFDALCKRQELHKRSFELEQSGYWRDSSFYSRFPDAVSVAEHEKRTRNFLEIKSSYLNFASTIRDAETGMLKQEELLVDLKIQYEQELNTQRQQLNEAWQLLYEDYRQWREKYLLVSNRRGVVSLPRYWSQGQSVNAGELLATVVPLEQTRIIGRASVDMQGIGKVRQGQKVNIKLNGFPYMEFGVLRGIVNQISLVPEKNKGYIATIELTEGMLSSYQRQLSFIQEIEGTAEIITADRRLLSRFIEPLMFKIKE